MDKPTNLMAMGFQSSTGRIPPIPMKDLYVDKISFFLDEWCEENNFVWWYDSSTEYIRIDFNEVELSDGKEVF